ncbi:autotransporter assembly complex protein TamA [Maritalea sp.]|uniref:autotransporter assembly complex protein TamA n=1 Tax=Maritalea sp. TaxID=2003361 RepID=UPI003EF7A0B1
MSKFARLSTIGMFGLVLGLSSSSLAAGFEFFGFRFGGEEAVQTAPIDANGSYVAYSTTVQTDNESLRAVITDASLLVADQAEPPEGTIGLITRARVDQKRILAALYAEAHYGALLDIRIAGQSLDDVPLDKDLSGQLVDVIINVDAGSTFVFSKPNATINGSPLDLSPYDIVQGRTAKSDLILSAQKTILDEWRNQGYPFAALEERTIQADHSTNQLDVILQFSTGSITYIGDISVKGAVDVKEQTIIQVADLKSGAIYDPEAIKRSTRQLQTLGVFNSVVIKPNEDARDGDQLNLVIEVSERKPRTIGVGVTAGNLDGLGIEGFWVHRNLFGGAEKLRAEASVGRIGQGSINDLDAQTALVFFKPNAFGPKTSFEGKISLGIENSNAFRKYGGKIEAGLSNKLREELTLKGGLAAEYAVITDENSTRNSSIVSAPFELIWDNRDDPLDPSEGIYATLFAEPTYAFNTQASFIKTSASASTYYSFDAEKKFVLAGRVAGGTIFGTSINNVPVDRRFYAGGAGSIRGYAYRAAGPLTANGNPAGGMSFIEASVEARYKVNEQIGVVAFVDTGGAFTSNIPGQGGSLYTGFGAGVRYLTPLGPIRADIAFPMNKIAGQPNYALYFGIGQAF